MKGGGMTKIDASRTHPTNFGEFLASLTRCKGEGLLILVFAKKTTMVIYTSIYSPGES